MNFDRMRALLLEQAVQGKLVPQLEDEPAVEQIGEAPNVVPLLIPKTWKWVRLNNLTTIVRGGSPRPIQAFLTDREDGLNWVKLVMLNAVQCTSVNVLKKSFLQV